MLERSIAINCTLFIFVNYFDSSIGKKKRFAKNAIFSCVQEACICLLVNMVIDTLNTKLIWVD